MIQVAPAWPGAVAGVGKQAIELRAAFHGHDVAPGLAVPIVAAIQGRGEIRRGHNKITNNAVAVDDQGDVTGRQYDIADGLRIQVRERCAKISERFQST
jgi:hypothetical protein